MKARQNTDREIWRKSEDGYAPNIFVTAEGLIGISVGGKVFVKPVEDWHHLARENRGTYKQCTQCGVTELDDGMSLPLTRCRNCGVSYGEESA